MTTGELFLSAWDWEPSIIAGCAGLATGYLYLWGRAFRPAAGLPPGVKREGREASRPAEAGRQGRSPVPTGSELVRLACFLFAVALLFLDLSSPIDTLGDQYLLSAHVLQHFLLALVIPPLVLLGIPRRLVEAALKYRAIASTEEILSRPAISWTLGVGTMVAWHIPVLFNAALANDALHIFQHLSFLVTGTIFWWPVLAPLEELRLRMLAATAYLFTACTGCSILGAILTFTPVGSYPAYISPADPDGILRLIRNDWGLDAKGDQELGGMLMWVPGCLVYLSAILASFARWYGASEAAAAQPAEVAR